MNAGGTLADNVGVAVVTWRNAATGASGEATGTTSWMAAVGLAEGPNAITVSARDVAGNVGTDTLTVTYDPVAPTVSISSPGANATLAAGMTTVTGTASDNVAVGKVQVSTDGVTWVDCVGTATWTCSLAVGNGVTRIHARATDVAGNSNSTTIPVTVISGQGPSGTPPGLVPVAAVGIAGALLAVLAAVLSRGRRRRPR